MSDLAKLETAALDAAKQLRGSHQVSVVIEYLEAKAQDVARRAMKTSKVMDIHQKQGEYAALMETAELLRSSTATVTRTKLRLT